MQCHGPKTIWACILLLLYILQVDSFQLSFCVLSIYHTCWGNSKEWEGWNCLFMKTLLICMQMNEVSGMPLGYQVALHISIWSPDWIPLTSYIVLSYVYDIDYEIAVTYNGKKIVFISSKWDSIQCVAPCELGFKPHFLNVQIQQIRLRATSALIVIW